MSAKVIKYILDGDTTSRTKATVFALASPQRWADASKVPDFLNMCLAEILLGAGFDVNEYKDLIVEKCGEGQSQADLSIEIYERAIQSERSTSKEKIDADGAKYSEIEILIKTHPNKPLAPETLRQAGLRVEYILDWFMRGRARKGFPTRVPSLTNETLSEIDPVINPAFPYVCKYLGMTKASNANELSMKLSCLYVINVV